MTLNSFCGFPATSLYLEPQPARIQSFEYSFRKYFSKKHTAYRNVIRSASCPHLVLDENPTLFAKSFSVVNTDVALAKVAAARFVT